MPIAKKIPTGFITFGCDPEMFFAKKSAPGRKARIIGAEKVLPKDGIGTQSKVIIDGIQAELNPSARSCRQQLAGQIKDCFLSLNEKMKTQKGLSIDFSSTVNITKGEMNKLSAEAKKFGCAPSKNAHDPVNEISIKDAETYMKRSAGGHIHIGRYAEHDTHPPYKQMNDAIMNPEVLVPILDILVGNTCVLLDRDPGNKERRKVYGKAGEYRTPKHGLEYRTLSNFWLKSYTLMSFVMGMTRQAVSFVAYSTPENDVVAKLRAAVNIEDIRDAINTNNFDLALRNFQKIAPIIEEYTLLPGSTGSMSTPALHARNMHMFMHFVSKGINHWFPEEPMQHWLTLSMGSAHGWESFLDVDVVADFKKVA